MDFSGAQQFHSAPQQVWNALHNPAILKESIPGARDVTITGNQIAITLHISLPMIGGDVTLAPTIKQEQPPQHAVLAINYVSDVSTLKGDVTIDLATDGAGTRLTYAAQLHLTGRIGVADNIVGKTAAQTGLNHFFKNLEQKV
ncbi:MAG TPA: SRPBCC domain-containing protein [Ktedonobacterales bacterium]|nr:SRPBCC domain-containing protein [Ktedonobacterales bacterium]